MKELNFETGLVTYVLNGKTEVSFNPTDANFVERLYMAFDELDKRQDSYTARVEQMQADKELFDFARECDAEMRNVIDGLFEASVCDNLFGSMNVYALADGLPAWANLMMAVKSEVEKTFAKEQKSMNPKIAKYTAKYQRK